MRSALRVLKEYYGQEAAHEDSEGGASGIIGLIEVCESLFEKSLADITSEEEAAAAEYTAVSKAARNVDRALSTAPSAQTSFRDSSALRACHVFPRG